MIRKFMAEATGLKTLKAQEQFFQVLYTIQKIPTFGHSYSIGEILLQQIRLAQFRPHFAAIDRLLVPYSELETC
jgi:hypothetical protein